MKSIRKEMGNTFNLIDVGSKVWKLTSTSDTTDNPWGIYLNIDRDLNRQSYSLIRTGLKEKI